MRLSAFSFGNLYKCSSLTWLLLIAIIHVQAQTAWIKGKVLDAKKQPLSGASIHIDQQELSILTDREGEYNI
ncbi:hypothetical protein OKW96_10700 [Sphingobacterium sp. KU25419]|nr:hypothetical protein OKW96_10700 [Sphingobacterium sp. KU25419]